MGGESGMREEVSRGGGGDEGGDGEGSRKRAWRVRGEGGSARDAHGC